MEANVERTIGILKMLFIALIGGLVMFTAIVLTLVPTGPRSNPSLAPVLMSVTGALILLGMVAQALLRRTAVATARREWRERRPTPDELLSSCLGLYSRVAIVGAALLEGPGLLGTTTYLLTGSQLALAAPTLAIAGLAVSLPTRERLAAFVRDVAGESGV